MLKPIAFDEALQRFVQTFSPSGTSMHVPLSRAAGRVLAAAVHAALDQPPADQSAMDGYAVRHTDIARNVALRIQQRCYAGDSPLALEPDCATRVFTGTLIPYGADTVVMQEDARESDGHVAFEAEVRAGIHIRRQGEEVRAGQTLVEAGVRLQPVHVGMVAAQGIDTVEVFHTVRVGILTTGDELVCLGGLRKAHQIYNSNAPMLSALVEGTGAMVAQAVQVNDNDCEISKALRELRRHCDLILSTGGASVGEKDLMRTALTSLGAQFVLDSVGMKPGKPVALARYDSAPVVVLPGNPGATLTAFALLVSPLIRRLQGRTECLPVAPRLPIDFNIVADATRDRFFRVRLGTSPEGLPLLQVLAQQGAGNLQTLAHASGLSRLPIGQTITRGDAVPYYDFARWLT